MSLPYPEKTSKAIQEHKRFMMTTKEAWKYPGEDAATAYALKLWHYKRNRDKVDLIIFYEELIENPGKIVLEMLRVLDISDDRLELCLSAMEKNSQEGVYMRVSQREVKGNDEAMEKFKGIIRKVFDIYDIDLKVNASLDELKHFMNKM